MLECLFGKKEEPFKKSIYIANLVIEAFSSDKPDGTCQADPIGAVVLRISASIKDGKIWLDKDVAWHELQHMMAEFDSAFGKPDDNKIK